MSNEIDVVNVDSQTHRVTSIVVDGVLFTRNTPVEDMEPYGTSRPDYVDGLKSELESVTNERNKLNADVERYITRLADAKSKRKELVADRDRWKNRALKLGYNDPQQIATEVRKAVEKGRRHEFGSSDAFYRCFDELADRVEAIR